MPKGRNQASILVPGQWLLTKHDGRKAYVPNPDSKGGRQCGIWRRTKKKIIGTSTIGNSFISINNVWPVSGLKHNLLNISQFFRNSYDVLFDNNVCYVINKPEKSIFFKGNVYVINLSELTDQNVVFLMSVSDEKWVWHKRLGHPNWRLISKLSKLKLVKGLPDLDYHSDALGGTCQIGNIYKTSFKLKSLSQPLDP